MSALDTFFDWFRDQTIAIQLLATVGIFAVLFVLGVFTAGIVPAIVGIVLFVDHLLRGERGSDQS
ncbi:hypothetical protein [Halalkaliarchaeum desulfuricum]|uniref:hypothetical protein n=1 Tax=Halalkaliarchaeum desulfuricum TaxID=2055893 RepID=UPI00105AB0D9|nr:hypothetical protein [Halalkaliarchaeum desulfuricum]